jgi:hypothetical protein
MSKEIAISNKDKELVVKSLPRHELAILERKASYHEQQDAVDNLPPYFDKKGNRVEPTKSGLMIRFNKLVKEQFQIGCDEIDKAKNVFMSNIVRALRDEFTGIIDEYVAAWDETEQHYKEMKFKLWELPVMAREQYEQKMNRLAGIKL